MNTANFDPYEFSKKEIDGVPVYYKHLPWAPCVHIRIVFNVGGFNDPVEKEGLSHFLEHMIFDGSPTLPNKKAIQMWKKLHTLNTWNASTRFNTTTYWLKCMPEKYTEALTGMKDMIFNSYIRPEDIEHERKVITQEAWGRFQNEKLLQYTKVYLKNIYSGHNHERFYTPLGWPSTIAGITHKDVKMWHTTHYGKGNFFILLVGAVEEKQLSHIEEFLRDIPKIIPSFKSPETFNKPLNPKFIKTADEIGEVKEQVEVNITRFAKTIPHEKESTSLIFRQLMYDTLNEKLRIEQSLCYSVVFFSQSSYSFFETGMSVKTEEKNVETVENEFWKIIKNIEMCEYKKRFDEVKILTLQQIVSQERLSQDIADDVVSEIVTFGGKIKTFAENVEEIKRVTYNDIALFAKETFDPEYTLTEIILPSKK